MFLAIKAENKVDSGGHRIIKQIQHVDGAKWVAGNSSLSRFGCSQPEVPCTSLLYSFRYPLKLVFVG